MISKAYRPLLFTQKDFDDYLEEILEERKTAPKSRKKIPDYLKEEILELGARGFSVREIRKRTGVNKSTVGRVLKEVKK